MKPAEKPALKFDDVLLMVGGSGRWQLYKILWFSKCSLILCFFMMAMIFLGAVPEHRCADGYGSDVTFADLPADAVSCPADNGTCARWVYDRSDLGNTMVTEWDLVCERKPLLALVQSLSMVGGLAGALLTGTLSDRFGRRPAALAGYLLFTVTALVTSLVRDYRLLLAVRFLCGMGSSFSLSPTVVLILEILTPEWRLLVGMLIQVPFALGLMLISGLAYLLPTWWHLQLALAAPTLLFAGDIWLMPESPRWLVANGRLKEAAQLLRQIALGNGAALPTDERLMEMLIEVKGTETDGEKQLVGTEPTGVCTRVLGGLWQLVRTPRMRLYTLITYACWLASGVSYFGISFDIGQLSSSRYVANCLSGLVEVPACILPWLMATQWGRRPTVCLLFLLTTVAILPTIASADVRLRLPLGLLGKFAVTAAFALLYIYTPEYVPTTLRTIGLGAASVSARIGSTVAPFVIDVATDLHPSMPAVIFGLLTLMAGIMALLLPETAGRRLPQTAAEVELGVWRSERAARGEKLTDLCPRLKSGNRQQAQGQAENKC
ncbi:organic cation transporter protein-like [Pollicipes pollicipes]|uniref:organic cation transporter protein-like n=1 Tax=Pollicipes pollicipes TaxID=41117 RepID=UPI001884FA6A|nr:organic cation transporter protein-like [Pollicipes pollicipes]